MRKSVIEKIVMGAVGLVVAIAVTSVMLVSFFDWQEYFKLTTQKVERPAKQVLQSIDAELVSGKAYYDNGLAAVKSEDVKVTAHYKKGEETIDEDVPSGQYEITVPADFTASGGTVTVTFKNKKATFDVELIAVQLESLKLLQKPYTIAYRTGERFSDAGLKIAAVYNDGSQKELETDDYVVDIVTPLVKGETKRTVSYSKNDIAKSLDIDISVADDFSNGRVVSISAADECFADPNCDIEEVKPAMKVTYESGNSVVIGENDYEITNDTTTVKTGRAYTLNISYKGNRRLTAAVPVTVRSHFEAEDAEIVGGAANSEPSYIFDGGRFTKTGETPGFAGGFAKSVQGGSEASISVIVDSDSDCTANVSMYCGNSYITKDADGYYWMQPLQINTIMDVTVNGSAVNVPDDVVLKGCGPSETTGGSSSVYAPLYGVYYEFMFEDVNLNVGKNVIKFAFKNSTEGARTCWGESPSTMNVDWINVDVKGHITPEGFGNIEIADTNAPKFGDDLAKFEPMVIGRLAGGERMLLDPSMYTVTKPDAKRAMLNQKYTYTAALESNPNIKATREFEIASEFKIEAENAKIEQSANGKMAVETMPEYVWEEKENGISEWLPSDSVTLVKGMDWTTTLSSTKTAKLVFEFEAAEGTYGLQFRLDNVLYFSDGTSPLGNFYTRQCRLADVINVYVNDAPVDLKDVALPAIEGMTVDKTFYVLYVLNIANVHLNDGANTLVIEGKKDSTTKNKWKEIAVPRFDWIKLTETFAEPPASEQSEVV